MIAPSIGSARNLALLLNFPPRPRSGCPTTDQSSNHPPESSTAAAPPTRRRPRRRRLSPSTIVLRASPSRRERDATFTHRPRTRASTRARPRHHRTVRESQKGVDTADTAVIATTRLTTLVVVLLVASRAETHRASPTSRPRAPLARPPPASSSLSGRSSTRHFLTSSRVVVARPCRRARRVSALVRATDARGAVRPARRARRSRVRCARDDDDDVPTSSESTDDGARLERWRARARACE